MAQLLGMAMSLGVVSIILMTQSSLPRMASRLGVPLTRLIYHLKRCILALDSVRKARRSQQTLAKPNLRLTLCSIFK